MVEDITPPQSGFLRIVRRRYCALYPDGSRSQPFEYDEVSRVALDASVIAAHFVGADGRRQVFLRSAVRPPLATRGLRGAPGHGAQPSGEIWELPAGLVEPKDSSSDPARDAALRELEEELGFRVRPDQLCQLGPSVFVAPGMIAEQHTYFEVEVNPEERGQPTLDGSALEFFGAVITVPLEDALEWCRQGLVEDAKTELALRRLHERLGLR
ncbi:MAG TPA: NUDIX hydrolase [Polyangiaceae bacterium]